MKIPAWSRFCFSRLSWSRLAISKFYLGAACLVANSVLAGQVYDTFPTSVKANEKYVFYSHGYIVEGDNPRPVDKRHGWGQYDFPAIKQALSDDSYNLVAYHRPKNTDPFEYAQTLNEQIRKLVAKGVKPENIAMIGFSRGAFITGLTSDKLSDLAIDTVLLAVVAWYLRSTVISRFMVMCYPFMKTVIAPIPVRR